MNQSIGTWQRECDRSMVNSHLRRRRHGMMPHGSEWRTFFALLTLAVMGWVLYILLWSVS